MPVRTLVVWCPDWPVVAAGFTAGEPVAGVHANPGMAGSAAARADGGRGGPRRPEAPGRWPGGVGVQGRAGAAWVELRVRLGIRTRGARAVLPAPAVLARFGPDGALAHRLVRGLDERPVAARTPPPDLVVTTELDPPADRVDTAAFAARAL